MHLRLTIVDRYNMIRESHKSNGPDGQEIASRFISRYSGITHADEDIPEEYDLFPSRDPRYGGDELTL